MTAKMVELKPGWLVGLRTSIRGNTTYDHGDWEFLDNPDGSKTAKWNTTRTTSDPAEEEIATKIRSKCQALIRGVCVSKSEFGLLCPGEKKQALDVAIDTAQALAAAFNAKSRTTTITIGVFTGYAAPDDARNIASVRAEVSEMISRMEEGIRTLDVDAIRDAASRAKEIAAILTPEVGNQLLIAVNETREAARTIVKAAKNGGTLTPSPTAIAALRTTRFAFLEDEPEINGEAIAFVPAISARAIEIYETLAEPAPELGI